MTTETDQTTDAPLYLEALNPEQREAVEHFEGPLLVLAGAGSGKTRVLTTRICHLIHHYGVAPDRILAVTFTNKAAGEMRERVSRMLGGEPGGMWLGTFHSLGARILRRHAPRLGWTNTFTIYDQDQSLRQIKNTQQDLDVDPKRWRPKAIRSQISGAKNNLISPQEFHDENADSFDLFRRQVAKVYPEYQSALESQNAFDFDDLLVKPVELFRSHEHILEDYRSRFQFILVDEYQDTNHAQFRFLEMLAREHENLMVVGDDDQCVVSGTRISTPGGEANVGDVGPGDEVTGGCGWGDSAPARIEAKMVRPYEGPVVTVETRSGRTLTTTPNHLVFGRLRIDPERWHVYLMRRDDRGYRIGTTRGVRSRRSGDHVSGLAVRTNQERADAVWVLISCDSEREARFHEARLAFGYGIPTTLFHAEGRDISLDEEDLDALFGEIDTEARAERLLADLRMFEEHPHHRPHAVVRGGTVRRRVRFTLFGDGRTYRGRPWRDHRIALITSGDELRRNVEAEGFPVRAGRRETWRVETARKSHDEGHRLARDLARSVEGEVQVRGRIARRGDGSTPTFEVMPASHLLPGSEVAVLGEDGTLAADEVVSREVSHYEGDVFDLSVVDLRNYVADGICVHNSIYGWRGADLRNILDFEETFAGAEVVRLEQNYRSTERILEAANAVIRQNVNRKGKTLRTERAGGEPITLVETADETDEARWIVDEIESRLAEGERDAREFAVLYRTNAQSRALEDAFRRAGLPYQIVGGVRFYERREIQDVLAYLRLISNPRDAEAFDRSVNYPRRGIGAVTQERLTRWADAEELALLEAAARAEEEGPDQIPTAGAASLADFAELIRHFSALASKVPVGELLEELVEELDLLKELRDEGPDGEDRAENVKELIAGAMDFEAEMLEEMEELPEDHFTDLDLFLQQVALVADIDRHDPDADAVTLMTLHNAKGLEFPYVFISGLEDGLFPLARAYDEPEDLEEERRLFYVGITRAEEKLYLTHARQRRRAGDFMYGTLSSFAEAIPPDLVEEKVSQRLRKSSSSYRGGRSSFGGERQGRRGRDEERTGFDLDEDEALNQDLPRLVKGERVSHPTFGPGTVLEVSGFGRDMKVTVNFDSVGRKKLMVRYAGLEKDF